MSTANLPSPAEMPSKDQRVALGVSDFSVDHLSGGLITLILLLHNRRHRWWRLRRRLRRARKKNSHKWSKAWRKASRPPCAWTKRN